MVGKRQHYIPRFYLKQFAIPATDPARVVLFRRGAEPKPVGTRDLAVQEHFYSKPEIGIDYSLDDKITDYETETLLQELATLLSAPDGRVDSKVASSFVVHMAVRTRALRDVMRQAIDRLTKEFSEAVESPGWLLHAMGSPDDPNSRFSKAFDEQLSDMGLGSAPPQQRAAIAAVLAPMLHDMLSQQRGEIGDALKKVIGLIEQGAPSAVAKKHQDILREDLAPEQRLAALGDFTWHKSSFAPGSLVLSDFVAISARNDEPSQPYLFAGREFDHVLFPICSDAVVIGTLTSPPAWGVDELNQMSASASLTSFFASRDATELRTLIESIGTDFDRTLNEAVEGSGLFERPNGV